MNCPLESSREKTKAKYSQVSASQIQIFAIFLSFRPETIYLMKSEKVTQKLN